MTIKIWMVVVTIFALYQTKSKEDLRDNLDNEQKTHLEKIDSLNKVTLQLDTIATILKYRNDSLKLSIQGKREELKTLRENKPAKIGGNVEETIGFFNNYLRRN